jgi:hypothetical protein
VLVGTMGEKEHFIEEKGPALKKCS